VDVEGVTDPGVDRGNDDGMAVGVGEAEVADERGVDDLVDDGEVVAATLGLAAQPGPLDGGVGFGGHADLLGRATSSPPQLGQRAAIASEHPGQNVHS
jgi:hypothetical protein